MKRSFLFLLLFVVSCIYLPAKSQGKPGKPVPKYDTIIRKHVEKPVVKPVVKLEIVIPVPEFINQPYYYDRNDNKLVRLENTTALLISKKKTLGLKGAKQFFSMDDASSKARFTAKSDIAFIIKTSGDVIDLTSYIKLYKFIPADEKRQVTITSKEGILNNNEEGKGRLVSFSVKALSKDNYLIQFGEAMEAGEYGFVWVKNMEQKEFNVFAFGIDWKNID
ncbi:MAG TPA: hypothetical protein VK644_06025 [Chitinophagaceae bacterium]|nr:hypothetical protein [Chitinophagaceae bacterium]